MKKFLAGFVSLVIFITAIIPVSAESIKFSDVSWDSWYYGAVEKISNLGIMKGKDEIHFCPNDTLTRAEAVTLIARYVAGGDIPYAKGCTWYEGYVLYLEGIGTLEESMVWDYESPITRGEFFVLVEKSAKHLCYYEHKVIIRDVPKGTALYDSCEELVKAGIIFGDDQGNINPWNTIKRAEVATVMARLLEADGLI